MGAIEICNVWKQFQLQSYRPQTLKEALVGLVRQRDTSKSKFWALHDVSIEIERGETFGIIGNNGSGKSTLLKLITNISRPTKGHVGVRGKVSALLELGAGFHPDFTGRENIFLNGAILGLRRKEIEKKLDEIVGFAELENFIDNPVKTYSSGMYMRLAFSIAIHVDPDILVIDEVLAVGDVAFQQKCFDQIHRFKHEGKTIVFVSHSLGIVQDLCQRAAWLDHGELRALGKTDQVLEFYSQQIASSIKKNKEDFETLIPDGSATIRNLCAFSGDGSACSILSDRKPAQFGFDLSTSLPPQELEVSARIFRTDGVCCYDQRALVASFTEAPSSAPISLAIDELCLSTGTYSLHLSVSQPGKDKWLDEKFFNFAVESPHRGPGIAHLNGNWLQIPLSPDLARKNSDALLGK